MSAVRVPASGSGSQAFVAFSCMRKFQKMGKKPEKGKEKAGGDNRDDDPSRTPEPYNCTGNIDTDFTELCRRAGMSEIPSVVVRAKPPGQQPPPGQDNKAAVDLNATATNVTAATDEADMGGTSGEQSEVFVPTTYILRSKYDYMKPVVQVDADPNDKKAIVKEIFVRNWKVDDTMMTIFKQALPAVEKLTFLTLYNVGLTDSTLEVLGSLVQECANLKTLNVEGSPVYGEEWHRLIMGENNKVWNLSLRNNRITDLGAKYLGYALGTPRDQNQTLVKLNLAFNSITGQGVQHLTDGLRMNRCLLVLDLSSNQIGDEGARSLADVMSTFKLTHEEVVERRIRMRDQLSPERSGKSPPSSRKTDRPNSKGTALSDKKGADKKGAAGGGAAGGGAKGGKGAGGGKDAPADKKDDKKAAKGGQDAGANANAAKGKKASNPPPVQVDPKAAVGKQQRGGKTTPKGPRGFSQGENENSDNYEQKHPLDDEVIYEDGDLWLKIANRSIISLNLNRNKVSEKGAYELLRAMKYQSRIHTQGPKNAPVGLMRLSLSSNLVDENHSYMRHLNAIMEERDVTAKNKVQPPTSASGGTPGVALNVSGQPIQADKTSTNNESGGGSISSAATTRAGSSLGQAQSRASSKTTLGGRGEPKGK
ncbi:leucine-rich repeat-containing protein 71-like isoform X2 [Convolutriloba macropyga]|uniref:leucine-rich repeat-containing protein 71-like isoform X2 n=1 Tax=Convolutriloba macropyga TaxID=536237 RepID=UPI003F521DE2